MIRRTPKERKLRLPAPTRTQSYSVSPPVPSIAPDPAPTVAPPPPPPPTVAPTALPQSISLPAPAVPSAPAAPKTIAALSMDLERDSQGHEHLHAVLRDSTGIKRDINLPGMKVGLDDLHQLDSEVGESKAERKERKKRGKEEKKAEKERDKIPAFRKLNGAFPPPKSERLVQYQPMTIFLRWKLLS